MVAFTTLPGNKLCRLAVTLKVGVLELDHSRKVFVKCWKIAAKSWWSVGP
jgi:hypothetical protein